MEAIHHQCSPIAPELSPAFLSGSCPDETVAATLKRTIRALRNRITEFTDRVPEPNQKKHDSGLNFQNSIFFALSWLCR